MSMTPQGIPPALLTVAEVATVYRVSRDILREWVHAGKLRNHSLTLHRILLSVEEVNALTVRGRPLRAFPERVIERNRARKGKANAAKAKA